MKSILRFLLAALVFTAMAFGQQGIPTRTLNGAGPPDPTLASVVGTHYIDISTANFYVCSAVTLSPTVSSCTWTFINTAIVGTPQTYYVCAKAVASSCNFNGVAGTGNIGPADTNDGLTVATPLLTIAGAQAKIAGKQLAAPVTIQLADASGTGSDCYLPIGGVNDTFSNIVQGTASVDEFETANGQAMQYPSSYIYLHGNDTTQANVNVFGAATCGGTVPSVGAGVRFANTNARVRGIRFQYFGAGSQTPSITGAINAFRSTVFVEDDDYISDGNGFLVQGDRYSHILFGSGTPTMTINNGMVGENQSFGSMQFVTPLGRSKFNINGTLAGNSPFLFLANEGSWMQVDGIASLNVTTSATVNVWAAIDHSGITWNDQNTFVAPAQTITYNGANLTIDLAQRHSYIRDACRTTGQLTCTFTSFAVRAKATEDSFVQYVAGAATADVATNFSLIRGLTTSTGLWVDEPTTFANLGTPVNGARKFCSDCLKGSNPCTGASTGTFAYRINGAWICF